jgi:hypothetical protein
VLDQLSKITALTLEISSTTNYHISLNLETHLQYLEVKCFKKNKDSFKPDFYFTGSRFLPFTYYAANAEYSPKAIDNGLNKVISRMEEFLRRESINDKGKDDRTSHI